MALLRAAILRSKCLSASPTAWEMQMFIGEKCSWGLYHVKAVSTTFDKEPGQHYRYLYIPTNELWIDREAKHDERQFFIDHLLVEHWLMAKGVPYEKALPAADRKERKERRRAGDVGRLTHHGETLPDGKDVHERLWQKLKNGLSVWIVNGRLVHSVFDIDFTEGGHDYIYEFVPENELWIDDAIEESERGYALLHELHERNRTAKG